MILDNAIMFLQSVGEASMYWVDDDTFDELFQIYESQKPDGYYEMLEDFHDCFEKHRSKKNFEYVLCQYNSYDCFEKPRPIKRMIHIL